MSFKYIKMECCKKTLCRCNLPSIIKCPFCNKECELKYIQKSAHSLEDGKN